MVRLSSRYRMNGHWHSVSMLAMGQRCSGLWQFQYPTEIRVSQMSRKIQTQLWPDFSRFSEKAGNLICYIFYMKSDFLNKCWQLTRLKNKTPNRPNKIHLEGWIQLGVTSSQQLLKVFYSHMWQKWVGCFISNPYSLNYMNKPEWNSLLSWGMEFLWVKFHPHSLMT